MRARVTLLLALGGCSESAGPGACAVRVKPEVCQTPANPRGADRVDETLSLAAPPELLPEPLADGRYVVTARTLYCEQEYDPPPVLSSVQGVLEISGCVLRETTFLGEREQPLIVVWSFGYGAEGTLELQLECRSAREELAGLRYGFDGSTLRLAHHSTARNAGGEAYACDYIDTWELR